MEISRNALREVFDNPPQGFGSLLRERKLSVVLGSLPFFQKNIFNQLLPPETRILAFDYQDKIDGDFIAVHTLQALNLLIDRTGANTPAKIAFKACSETEFKEFMNAAVKWGNCVVIAEPTNLFPEMELPSCA
ncbi:hypothetical protein P7F88_19395 [Vibrio hannami]|uniref:hypothetical protein n=1 Tax=Vibrio hannami TaxID=2717094 RepID=UPI0024106556|nr:hypothetical protein [Vibrio hannami]MDG3088122.1 hypothetical protein [Vibrio hannami]